MHYNQDVRRALASVLLSLLSFPLISALLLANTLQDLPACCRRAGSHHCAMMQQEDAVSDADGAATLKAVSSKCPLFPGSVSLSAMADVFTCPSSIRLEAPAIRTSPVANVVVRDTGSSDSAANGKRGPPSFIG